MRSTCSYILERHVKRNVAGHFYRHDGRGKDHHAPLPGHCVTSTSNTCVLHGVVSQLGLVKLSNVCFDQPLHVGLVISRISSIGKSELSHLVVAHGIDVSLHGPHSRISVGVIDCLVVAHVIHVLQSSVRQSLRPSQGVLGLIVDKDIVNSSDR